MVTMKLATSIVAATPSSATCVSEARTACRPGGAA